MQSGFLVRLEVVLIELPGAQQLGATALQQLARNRQLRSILGVLSNCQLNAAALHGDITALRISFTQLSTEPIERMVIQFGLRSMRSLLSDGVTECASYCGGGSRRKEVNETHFHVAILQQVDQLLARDVSLYRAAVAKPSGTRHDFLHK